MGTFRGMAAAAAAGMMVAWAGMLAVRAVEAEDTQTKKKEPMLAHMVFFTLNERTPAAKAALVESCHKYLKGHDGIKFFAVGTLAEDLRREVNDLEFDVALHIVFKDKAAHDVYQDSAMHQKFIAENKSAWKKVRVFDSYAD